MFENSLSEFDFNEAKEEISFLLGLIQRIISESRRGRGESRDIRSGEEALNLLRILDEQKKHWARFNHFDDPLELRIELWTHILNAYISSEVDSEYETYFAEALLVVNPESWDYDGKTRKAANDAWAMVWKSLIRESQDTLFQRKARVCTTLLVHAARLSLEQKLGSEETVRAILRALPRCSDGVDLFLSMAPTLNFVASRGSEQKEVTTTKDIATLTAAYTRRLTSIAKLIETTRIRLFEGVCWLQSRRFAFTNNGETVELYFQASLPIDRNKLRRWLREGLKSYFVERRQTSGLEFKIKVIVELTTPPSMGIEQNPAEFVEIKF